MHYVMKIERVIRYKSIHAFRFLNVSDWCLLASSILHNHFKRGSPSKQLYLFAT